MPEGTRGLRIKGVFKMLTIVLKILSILGILLLALFLLAAAVLLLILFVPVTYRISGAKDEDGFRISAKVKWLYGLVRLQYGYPEPGEAAAKILFFTLYRVKIPPDETAGDSRKAGGAADSNIIKIPSEKFSGKIMTALQKKKNRSKSEKKRTASIKKTGEPVNGKKAGGTETDSSGKKTVSDSGETGSAAEAGTTAKTGTATEAGTTAKTGTATEADTTAKTGMSAEADGPGTNVMETDAVEENHSAEEASAEENLSSEESVSGFGKILQKFEKIKYTIHNIYDKIKWIWDNISYYLELLQEEETRQFFSHVRMRTGKMVKSVWPRHIRADILFGTGSPDTTGYLYGAYCMVSPMLKKGINVTPDFEETVLQADFDIAGHITIWVLAMNTCRIVLDKRLRHLIKKAVSPGIKTVRKRAA